jgi:hypothetical protein
MREIPWDTGAARAAIETIVADTRKAFTPTGLWPIHPDDGPPEWGALTGLYFGAAGVIWALDYLQREEAAREGATFAEHLGDIQARNAHFVAAFGGMNAGYLLGETGVLLVRWRIEGDRAVLDRLAELIAANTEAPPRELMWGAPGTMLVALTLYEETAEPRWAELFRAGAAALATTFTHDESLSAPIWTQELYGQSQRYLAPSTEWLGTPMSSSRDGASWASRPGTLGLPASLARPRPRRAEMARSPAGRPWRGRQTKIHRRQCLSSTAMGRRG